MREKEKSSLTKPVDAAVSVRLFKMHAHKRNGQVNVYTNWRLSCHSELTFDCPKAQPQFYCDFPMLKALWDIPGVTRVLFLQYAMVIFGGTEFYSTETIAPAIRDLLTDHFRATCIEMIMDI